MFQVILLVKHAAQQNKKIFSKKLEHTIILYLRWFTHDAIKTARISYEILS